MFYDIPKDWYSNFNNNYLDNNNLDNSKDAFLRGNLFNNLYDPYKNYKYKELKVNSKKEELLYNILKNNFALIELDLYLDIYPEDNSMINLYTKYLSEKENLIKEYESIYGPLTLSGINNTWNWIDSPWPWEVDK